MLRLSRFVFLVCGATLSWAAGRPSVSGPSLSQAHAALTQLPLRFEANQGQTDPAVLYTAHSAGYTLFLTSHGPSLALPASRRVDISLLDSNRAPHIEALDRLRARTDYFIGRRASWRTGVPSYSRVRYRAVYPGIDVIYYGKHSQLEYDFVLAPGADPRAIRLKFQGASRVQISPEGDLVVEAGRSRFLQKKPLIYQDASGRRIGGHYVLLARNVVGLRLDPYDRSQSLVIDPTITYCSYLGGTLTDSLNAVKLTPQGLLYVAGFTESGDFTAVGYYYDPYYTAGKDVFIAILDTTQGFNLVYLTYLGGSGDDIPLGMDVDSSGVIYLTGTTTSADFPVSSNAFQTIGAGSATQAYVLQLDPSVPGPNALYFSSFLGGTTAGNSGNGIVVDPNGLIDVIGTTMASDFPVTANAYQAVLWGPSDVFLCQIDPVAGALNYATYLGGENDDDGRAIVVDSTGLVYFAASTLSSQFPMAGYNYSGVQIGAEDVIVGIMDFTQQGSSSLVYSTYFGGSANDEVRGLAFDSQGNLIITGYTLSTDFPVTANAIQSSYHGNSDGWVAVVNPNILGQGFLIYSTYLGGADGDAGYRVASDAAGNIYVAGYTLSADFPASANALQATWPGGTDTFITTFNPTVAGAGSIQFSTFFGATNIYLPYGLTVGPDGTIYVVGVAGPGLNSEAGFSGGASDGFILAISQ
jgi:hypothetical protein